MDGEDIKTISNDFGKSIEAEETIKIGKKTMIANKLHEWDGENWMPVKE